MVRNSSFDAKDTGSKTGTRVNGHVIQPHVWVAIAHGDVLVFGPPAIARAGSPRFASPLVFLVTSTEVRARRVSMRSRRICSDDSPPFQAPIPPGKLAEARAEVAAAGAQRDDMLRGMQCSLCLSAPMAVPHTLSCGHQ